MAGREWFVMSNPFAEKQQMTMVRGQFKQIQAQQQRTAVAHWLSRVLSIQVPDDADGFWAALRDGEQLLRLLEHVVPENKININTGRSLNEFKIRENINNFLEGVKKIGVRTTFVPNDLVEKKNIHAVVSVLLDLANVARQRGFTPRLGEDGVPAPSSPSLTRNVTATTPTSSPRVPVFSGTDETRQEEQEFVELFRKSDEVNDFIQQVEAHKPYTAPHTAVVDNSGFEQELSALREEVERLKLQGIVSPIKAGTTGEEERALPPAPKVDPLVEQELRKLREEVEMLRTENKEILSRSNSRGSQPPVPTVPPFGNTPATKSECSCFVVTLHGEDKKPVVLKIDIEGITLLTPYSEEQILTQPWRRIRSWAVNGSADILKVEYLNLAAAQAGREEFDHLECMTVEARLILNAFLVWVGKKREQMKADGQSPPTKEASKEKPPEPKRKGSFFNRKKGNK